MFCLSLLGLTPWMTATGPRVSAPAHFPCDGRVVLLHMKADQVTPWLQPFRGSLLSSGHI